MINRVKALLGRTDKEADAFGGEPVPALTSGRLVTSGEAPVGRSPVASAPDAGAPAGAATAHVTRDSASAPPPASASLSNELQDASSHYEQPPMLDSREVGVRRGPAPANVAPNSAAQRFATTVPPGPIAPTSVPATPQSDMADRFTGPVSQEVCERPPAQHHASPPIHLSDEVIDRIATRVADRLIHGLLGDKVIATINEVSERLVREEIARIRTSAVSKNTERAGER